MKVYQKNILVKINNIIPNIYNYPKNIIFENNIFKFIEYIYY